MFFMIACALSEGAAREPESISAGMGDAITWALPSASTVVANGGDQHGTRARAPMADRTALFEAVSSALALEHELLQPCSSCSRRSLHFQNVSLFGDTASSAANSLAVNRYLASAPRA